MSLHSEDHAPARKAHRTRWLGLAVLVILVGAGGVLVSGAFDAPHAADVDPAPQVTAEPQAMRLHPSETYTVAPRDLSAVVEFTGTVRPAQRADISAQVSGIANAVLVEEGQTVEAGEVLVSIDTTDLELQLRQQQATMNSTQIQLDAARESLDRTRALAERGLTPQSTLDAAIAEVDRLQASLASLQSQVEQVEANIARANIRAPFSGTVASRSVEPGQVVSQGAALISLVDLSRLSVDALVPLAASSAIEVGQSANVSIHGLNGTGFEATVERINPVAEEGTRSIVVHLALDNTDQRLRGGMFATGSIVTERSQEAIAIPRRSVMGEEGDAYVLALEDGELVQREITVAQVWDRQDAVELAGGLEAGDVIVSLPLSGLEAGQPVVVEEL